MRYCGPSGVNLSTFKHSIKGLRGVLVATLFLRVKGRDLLPPCLPAFLFLSLFLVSSFPLKSFKACPSLKTSPFLPPSLATETLSYGWSQTI